MRRATFLLAALAGLAGCSVETEGAACQVPGSTGQCPEGQRCGTDGRCATNPVIACPAPGAEIAVDAASPSLATVIRTGAPQPVVCRFAELGPALALAAERTSPVTVKVHGPSTLALPAPLPVVLSEYTTLTTDAATPDPASHVLQGVSGSTGLLRLEGGATLRGFTVASTGATGDAIEIVCGGQAGAAATLSDVIVDGGTHTARGVVLGAAACPLAATRLEVRNGTGSGLFVGTGVSTLGATVDGLSSHDNSGQGVQVASGLLAVVGQPGFASVAANAQGGILLEGTQFDASLESLVVSGNIAAGLYIRNAGGSTVRVEGSVFAKNASTVYGSSPNERHAGGVLLRGNALPATFVFLGNTVCGNTDDEIGVFSTANWTLGGDGTTCADPLEKNTVYDATGGMHVFSTAGNVNAEYFTWPTSPPDEGLFSPNVDFDPNCRGVDDPPTPLPLPAACQ